MVEERKDAPYETGRPLCDCLRFVCDASYAVLPEDLAHQIGEMKKNLWGCVRWLVEKRIECIDACVAGGDRLRQEWRSGDSRRGFRG